MLKAVRWRSERSSKITAVFKLHFHLTQASQFEENALVLSLIPADIGKPTAKLEKSSFRDGCCYWEPPVYQTVKLNQEPKAGTIQDKIYHFTISSELQSKSTPVGEFSLNIADYAEATTKASLVSFPFKDGSDSVLHVSIQRIQENANRRCLDENEDSKLKFEDRSLKRYFSNGDAEDSIRTDLVDDEKLRRTASQIAETNGNHTTSSVSDITLSSSGGSSGLNTPRELGMTNNAKNVHVLNGLNCQDQHRTRWENWLLVPANDSCTDNSTNSPRESFLGERSNPGSDESVEKLRAELVALARNTEVSELELQTLRKQIVKESKRGQDLSREITILRDERDGLKRECEKLKTFNRCNDRNKLQFEEDPWALLEEVKEELNYEKEINVNLRLQLQKTQDSNAELILAVQDLEEMLENNNDRRALRETAEEIGVEESVPKCPSDEDEEQKALEEIVRQHTNDKETYLLEQKIMDLCSEIEMYRRDKDELGMQMEQLALDYEILKQEHHDLSYKMEQSQIREQLKLQYEFSGSYAAIHELEAEIEKLENELKQRSRELSDSWATVKELETHNHKLEEELDKQAYEFEAHMKSVIHAKEELEQRATQAEEAVALSRGKINELETQIANLENELKQQSNEFSDSLSTIRELETHIQNLEEELEKQARGFEADLEDVTRAKVEQEQRAIRAEEALRFTRWKNANTAARIQEEFKRLSAQMQSSFEANEKVAKKAMAEATELRLRNSHLDELLQKANERVQSIKDDHEAKLRDLYNDMNLKSIHVEQEKSKEVERQKKQTEEIHQSFSLENSNLKSEIKRLAEENHSLLGKAKQSEISRVELEEMKMLIKEQGSLDNMERDNLEGVLEELNVLRHVKEEKELAVTSLQFEVNILRAQCDDMKHSLHKDEMEKEKLRKQMLQLKGELKKKEDAITSMERKLKDNNRRGATQDKSRATSDNAKFEPSSRTANKEVARLRERIKSLEGHIKSKETALDTSNNAFLAKEKGLRSKIEELESKLEELNKSNAIVSKDEIKEKISIGMQVDSKDENIVPNSNMSEGESTTAQNLNNVVSIIRDEERPLETQREPSDNDKERENVEAMLKEMESLKQQKSAMESELKEMQERYSEISLKFAEVEGERQQLIMTLRNLKNSKKC